MKKNLLSLLIIIVLAVRACAQSISSAQVETEKIFKEWVKGLNTTSIAFKGAPSCLLAFGMESYPIFQTNAERCGTFGVAAKAGAGRVAAFSQTDYPSYSNVLNSNVRKWLGETSSNPSQVLNLNNLSESRFLTTNLRDIRLITWTNAQDFPSERSLDKLENFVRNGGGLLVAHTGWVLTYYKGLANINNFSINKLLKRFGIVLTDGYLKGDSPSPKSIPSVRNFNAYYAVQAGVVLSSQEKTLWHAIEVLPTEVLDSVGPIYEYLNHGQSKITFPIRKANFRSKITAVYKAKDYDKVHAPKAIEGIDEIPGVVQSKERRNVVLTLNREVSDSWVSTGYYLAAGEVLTVTALSPVQAWEVQIGCHSDSTLNDGEWKRHPVIIKKVKLVSTVTKITSPFGGLIYLVSSGSSCRNITVNLSNVVEAPFFDLDSPKRVWNVKAPGPVGEIQGKFHTMSFPTRFMVDIKDPTSIARYWDEIIQQNHKIRNTTPTRRERFVADIDISENFKPSGYPIMTLLDFNPKNRFIAIQMLDSIGSWELLQKIGRNMQRDWWTFNGTSDVTCNIFTLYAFSPSKSSLLHPLFNDVVIRTTIALNRFINKTKEETYAWYRSDPSAFLVQYAMIQHYFGWEAYAKVFAAYEATTGPRPEANQDKIDTWVRELSKAVGRNLLPYFEIWRMPVSDKGVAEVTALGLLPWMPGNQDYGISNIDQRYLDGIRAKHAIK